MLNNLASITNGKTLRTSSWATDGRNFDYWTIGPGETVVLADIVGCGKITHIWMTQGVWTHQGIKNAHFRECLIKITWDDAAFPSILCPLGDFFGLGHGIANSYQSLLFSASTNQNNKFNQGCALNSYVPMFFRKRAKIELINESKEDHRQFFYIDYELDDSIPDNSGYFNAEFRRNNRFEGWGPEIGVNSPESDIANKERTAWDNNYVILDTKGEGHYIGCNISVTNLHNSWWGEGDDMIWVDGYKWPPDLHGTGSEDYLNQAWCMQDNAFLRNGSSIFEENTRPASNAGGYQTSYVHHIENPVRFKKEIKVTIEHGHGNHLTNEMSSVAYWYSRKPAEAIEVPPLKQRLPIICDNQGNWIDEPEKKCPGKPIELNDEMKEMKKKWAEKSK